MTSRTIRRDPFGRLEVVRTRVTPGLCDYCGRLGPRWRYQVRWSSGRVTGNRGAFCSIDCWEVTT